MDGSILNKRVGNTPLVRAKNLERELGIEKIYLKLEGNNPSGHREDRLAHLIIRDALTRDKRTICMGTFGTVGGSLAYLAGYYDVKCIFVVPDKKRILRKNLFEPDYVELIEHGRTYEDCVKESRRLSEENGWYNANPGRANNILNMHAFSYLAGEMQNQIHDKIDTVFCQTSNGSSISGLHLGFKQMWATDEVGRIPRIYAASTAQGNPIVESFEQNNDAILDLDPKSVKPTKYNRNVTCYKAFNGQDALNAIRDSEGKAIGIKDEELLSNWRDMRKWERFIKLSVHDSFPISAFRKAASEGMLGKGNHIIVLNDGKVDLDIRILRKKDLDISYRDFLKKLDTWLIRFTDPLEEIQDAVDDAFKNGFVLAAYRGSTMVGITILSTSRYERFFPKYHLSYIATKKDIKGMGIATQLMQKAIEVTGGEFTLHVEADNKRAIKLYEKMGLKKKYYRMFYRGGVHGEEQ